MTALAWKQLAAPAKAKTAAAAISKSGLDWTTSLRTQAFLGGPPEKEQWIEYPGRYTVVRDDTDTPYGTVGTHYEPLQNIEAFTFADDVVVTYECGGELAGGAFVFLVAQVGGSTLNGIAIDYKVLLRTAHTGTKSVSVYMAPVTKSGLLLACETFGKAKQKWPIQHIGTARDRMAATDTTDRVGAYIGEYEKLMSGKFAKDLTDAAARDLLERVIPNKPRKPKTINKIVDIWLRNTERTYFTLLIAVCEFFETGRTTRSAEAIFTSAVDGPIAVIRNRFVALALTH